jgi:hypothetical protein
MAAMQEQGIVVLPLARLINCFESEQDSTFCMSAEQTSIWVAHRSSFGVCVAHK